MFLAELSNFVLFCKASCFIMARNYSLKILLKVWQIKGTNLLSYVVNHNKSKVTRPCEPILQRQRKIRDVWMRATHWKIFFEMLDVTTNSLSDRFQKTFMEHFSKVEDFATGEICVDLINDFCKSDFDKEKLLFIGICF